MQIKKLPEETINKKLQQQIFSLDSKTPAKIITSKPLNFKQALLAATIVNNNIPNIKDVKGEHLKNIDLITYSFPCQGLSIANMGRDKGIKDLTSTSSLVWEIQRILKEAKKQKIPLPKYLLMENVKNLKSKKHKPDYDKWIESLKKIGYTTYSMVLNSLNHQSLQKRDRLYAISIFQNKRKWTNEELQEIIKTKYGKKFDEKEREKIYYKILNSSNKYLDEIQDSTPNKTPSRIKMERDNHNLLSRKSWKENEKYTFNTLSTKQDRHPNIGMISLKSHQKQKNKLSKRFITPREAYKIMGFKDNDFKKIKSLYKNKLITKESLYRQAGNSIVVSVLQDLFTFINNYESGKYE